MTKNLSEEIHSQIQRKIDNSSNIDLQDIKNLLNELSIYEAELHAQNKELRAKEQELEESRQAYYDLFYKSPTPFLVIDKDLIIQRSNLIAKEYFNLSFKMVDKISLQMFIEKSFLGEFVTWIIEKRYEDVPLVCKMLCHDQNKRFFLINAREDTPKSKHLFLTFTDIDQQKKLEAKSLEQKEEFETIFKYAQEGIALTDLEGNFTMVNGVMEEMTGYSSKELLQKNCNDITDPHYRKQNTEAIQKVLNGKNIRNFEKECIVKDDRKITVNVSISLLPNKKNLLFLISDITSLKLFEEQCKLASMGEMIGNIAHQWRQPLSIITTSISGLEYEVDTCQNIDSKHVKETSDLIIKQAEYLSQTIDNFKNFLKGDHNHSKLSIKKLFDYTFSLVEATIKNNYINLITNIDENLYIDGNINELSEAFINIINNSKDLLQEKVPNPDDRLLFIDAFQENESDVIITLQDSGGGVPQNLINKIFEPYFTTKHQSMGTGLGLSISENIIRERHKGTLHVKNNTFTYNEKTYTGACFTITLKAST